MAFDSAALGDVLVGCHPAAVRCRLTRDHDGAPVVKFVGGGVCLRVDTRRLRHVVLRTIPVANPLRHAPLDDVAQRRSRLHLLR